MTTKSLRQRKSVSLTKSRWTAYAAAGAASAIAGVSTAEADIHYSGPINSPILGTFGAGNYDLQYFQLDAPGNSFGLIHIMATAGSLQGVARFINADNAGAFRGFLAGGYDYVSRLASGNNIGVGAFNAAAFGTMAFRGGYGNDPWLAAGTGFIGFQFDSGSGIQYGWVRVTMSGSPLNGMTIVDYAWGDVGTAIAAGQIPEPGSLGLLALGGVGLLAWRKRRAKAA